MTKALAKRDPRDIQLAGATLTSTGIVFDGEMSFDEWEGIGQFIERSEGAILWWAGDWLNYGEGRPQWGDKYEQAIGMFNRSYDHLRDWKRTSVGVQFGDRSPNLSWTHHRVVAHLPRDEQREWLTKAEPDHPDQLPKMSVSKLKQAIADLKALNPPPIPIGQYRCVVIDPPWPVQKIVRSQQRPDQTHTLDYRTMDLDEIAALPLDKLGSDDGAHIYLWVTQKFLPDGIALLERWGYHYQCTMTWVKPTGMTPFSWMYNTEHVLFGTKGGLTVAQKGLKLSFEAAVAKGTHSTKPDVFYERVILASPEPRLNMFARQSREGFDAWGNEVEDVA